MLIMMNALANNMLIQNVTTTGNNAAAKTIQVQFDMSWDNSWRDGINWDAAWVFIKFKKANGLWEHAKLNQAGFANGSGTANTMQVTSDKLGSWVYRSASGTGTFNATGMQLQWNYGLSGLNDVTGLEVRVFSTEMVYIPEGEFNCGGSNSYGKFYNDISFTMPSYSGNPVVNQRLTPPIRLLSTYSTNLFRVKGDAGIDYDNDESIDNTTFPTGYRPFYVMKYELTEQQYTDMLNTCDSIIKEQIKPDPYYYYSSTIFLNNGNYFTSKPNKACNAFNSKKYLAMKNWYGLRQISQLEMNKLTFGPLAPFDISGQNPVSDVGKGATSQTTFSNSGATYYGVQDIGGNLTEPVIPITQTNFIPTNGNGFPEITNEQYINNQRTIKYSTSVSSAISDGSGGANLCNCGKKKGTAEVIMSGINATSYSKIYIQYLASKNCYSGKVSVFWSKNGISWNPISYSDVNPTNICSQWDVGTYTWQNVYMSLPSDAGNSSNLRIKWLFEDLEESYISSGDYTHYRIDDLKITGSNPGSYSYTIAYSDFGTNDYDDISYAYYGSGFDFKQGASTIINCCARSDYSSYSSSTDGFRYCRSAE